jgi:hypothetical protein
MLPTSVPEIQRTNLAMTVSVLPGIFNTQPKSVLAKLCVCRQRSADNGQSVLFADTGRSC